jgi:hypothetical protein
MIQNAQYVEKQQNVLSLENVITMYVHHFAFRDWTHVQCVPNLKIPIILKVMNEHEKFCVEEANYHLQRARELLTDSLRDAKKYHDEAKEFYRMMAKLFPLMILLQHSESQLPDSETEESLSDTQSSSQSDSDSYMPATLPGH